MQIELKVVTVYLNTSHSQVLFDLQFPNGLVQTVTPNFIKYCYRYGGVKFSNLVVTRLRSVTREVELKGSIRVDADVERTIINSFDYNYIAESAWQAPVDTVSHNALYLTKAVDLTSNEEVYKLTIPSDTQYELSVCDELGNEVSDYNIMELYGSWGSNDSVTLYVLNKRALALNQCLSFWRVLNNHSILQHNEPKIYFLPFNNDYFIFDSRQEQESSSKNIHTLAGILTNTDRWRVEDDTLIIYADNCTVLFRITDIAKFHRILAKLVVLKDK